jgi:hypothetical protein
MLNSRLLKPEEKVFVIYKDNPPARVIAVEKRGRKHYLLLRWDNLGGDVFKPEKWVKDTLCTEYKPEGSQKYKAPGRMPLNWLQKLIVKLQNWWYELRD